MPEFKLSAPQEYIATSTQELLLFLAGVGSGKTHLLGVNSGYYINNFPEAHGFIGANTFMQLSTSTLSRTFKVWDALFNLKVDRDYKVDKIPPKSWNIPYFKSYHGIISFKNGCVVYTGSLDNAKAHDGKEFSWGMLDETKDSREDDVKETILTRLRGGKMFVCNDTGQVVGEEMTTGTRNRAFNPLFIYTSPAKVDWINEWFKLTDKQNDILSQIYDEDNFYFEEFDDKCVVISSTYHNKENLPVGYIEKIVTNNTKEKAKKLIYGNPFVKAGGEFYSGFDRALHVKPVTATKDMPIHLTFDQNVKPYITGLPLHLEIKSDIERPTIKIQLFDEICLKNPRNKTSKLCLEYIKRYGTITNGLYYYGDPAGKHSDTRGAEHDYQIVKRVLRPYLNNSSDRVAFKHPPVIKRKDFINNILEGIYTVENCGYDISIEIDPKCKNSIADFEFVKEDINGKKDKSKIKGEDGTYYEKYGHCSDAFDYFVCKALEWLFLREFK